MVMEMEKMYKIICNIKYKYIHLGNGPYQLRHQNYETCHYVESTEKHINGELKMLKKKFVQNSKRMTFSHSMKTNTRNSRISRFLTVRMEQQENILF